MNNLIFTSSFYGFGISAKFAMCQQNLEKNEFILLFLVWEIFVLPEPSWS
jgi:hypothetical protein